MIQSAQCSNHMEARVYRAPSLVPTALGLCRKFCKPTMSDRETDGDHPTFGNWNCLAGGIDAIIARSPRRHQEYTGLD